MLASQRAALESHLDDSHGPPVLLQYDEEVARAGTKCEGINVKLGDIVIG